MGYSGAWLYWYRFGLLGSDQFFQRRSRLNGGYDANHYCTPRRDCWAGHCLRNHFSRPRRGVIHSTLADRTCERAKRNFSTTAPSIVFVMSLVVCESCRLRTQLNKLSVQRNIYASAPPQIITVFAFLVSGHHHLGNRSNHSDNVDPGVGTRHAATDFCGRSARSISGSTAIRT